jgi:FlaG/FlaF family flagellin (archaellin)
VFARRHRATSSVYGATLLVAVTIVLVVVGGALVSDVVPTVKKPVAQIDCRIDARADRVACVHGGGDRLDLRNLRIHLTVDGEPLAHQPPVPFFAARGFHAGPTGPFNSAADPYWSAGETAALRLAGTNEPGLTPDVGVVVRVVSGGNVVARADATAV